VFLAVPEKFTRKLLREKQNNTFTQWWREVNRIWDPTEKS
jgi:hypothetical protein